ncbi:Ypt/Rab-GAP domain of gyp1p superfamily protein [Abeliophyllum distichum]|uniref:Ypt/Rab-GAP domain of gyp1p superfamily protein n=1 Tax=Abeliophyllum distichum TaxID=126358 RepID=A0ABD1T0K2_9LAMI
MSFDGDDKQWKCGKGGAVNFHKVSSIVRDIGEPCLHQSPIKVVIAISKMLKPEKWQATFDSEGKIMGFPKSSEIDYIGGCGSIYKAGSLGIPFGLLCFEQHHRISKAIEDCQEGTLYGPN